MADLVSRARQIAEDAHGGVRDKTGAPYIGHPARVARRVADAGYGPEHVAVAWLHDVVEDHPDWTLEALRAAGMPDAVISGVDSVTKRRGERLEDAIARAAADEIGRVVKAADVADNLDPRRVAALDAQTAARLAGKYEVTLRILAEAGAPVFT